MKIFEYTAIWHPSDAQLEDDPKLKAKLILDFERVLASDIGEVNMIAARMIPDEYADQLDQIELVVRPF